MMFWICFSSNNELDLTLYKAVSKNIVCLSVWKKTEITSICFSICLTSFATCSLLTLTTITNLKISGISDSDDVMLAILICLFKNIWES